MNNILLLEKYLVEIKTSIKNFIQECENFKIPYEYIKTVMEYIYLTNGDDIKASEVIDFIFTIVPELYHCHVAIEAMNNLISLFNGDMNYLFNGNGMNVTVDEFILMAKNILKIEMEKYDEINSLYKENDVDNLLSNINNININK